jgi:hypothetical protein
MNMPLRYLLSVLYFLILLSCETVAIDPWGIWNREMPNENDSITQLSYGRFYQISNNELRILENCREGVAGKYDGPAFTIEGMYVKVKKYSKTTDGYRFILYGRGSRKNPITGKREWKDDVYVEVQMIILSDSECKFKILTERKPDLFFLDMLTILDESKIFYRKRAPVRNSL